MTIVQDFEDVYTSVIVAYADAAKRVDRNVISEKELKGEYGVSENEAELAYALNIANSYDYVADVVGVETIAEMVDIFTTMAISLGSHKYIRGVYGLQALWWGDAINTHDLFEELDRRAEHRLGEVVRTWSILLFTYDLIENFSEEDIKKVVLMAKKYVHEVQLSNYLPKDDTYEMARDLVGTFENVNA